MKITCTCCENVYYEEGSCPKCGEPLKSNHIDKNFNSANQNENIPKVITDYYKRKITYGCIGFIAIFILAYISKMPETSIAFEECKNIVHNAIPNNTKLRKSIIKTINNNFSVK